VTAWAVPVTEPPPIVVVAPATAGALLDDRALGRIFAALDHGEDETRIVGGAVRDALLDRPVHEIDLATTLPPETIVARAQAAGLRCIPTGFSHGTVTLIVEGRPFEVTSLREDVETDGRRAKVRFGRDFATDASRRDFTMNALFLGEDGRLHDYVGGLADIAARKVRFIGDPARRIREDYLRILRFFRFSAAYGEGALDPAGLLAAIRERDGLARLSKERIHAELRKLLLAPHAVDVVETMSQTGLLGPLLGAVPNPARLRRAAAIEAERAPDPLLRLAALSVLVAEDAARLRERLRLSNAEHRRLEGAAEAAIGLHGREAPPDRLGLRGLLFRAGRQATEDALVLTQADARSPLGNAWDDALAFVQDAPIPRLAVSGAEVMARGVTNGRAIGKVLNIVEARWAEAGFPADPDFMGRMLDEVVTGEMRSAPRADPEP
jgi:poly(A) polymerase